MAKNTPVIKVKISTPTDVLWEGEAESVSSINSQGPFDILPKHANFVTLVQGEPISVRSDQRERQYSFKNAVIHTDKDSVRIYGDV
jgi:F0F1-type ATP synthase epsilon subunit